MSSRLKPQLISRAELKAKVDNKERFHLWNVQAKEFHKPEANIAGSKWIPLDAITAKFIDKKVAAKGETIVVYSGGSECGSSIKAAEKLQSLGCTNVFAYEGGLKDWSENGFSLVKI